MDSGLTGEQFSLCWNNFHSNLTTGFHSLLKEEDLVDVTLATEGKFIKAHKLVLSVCSPFFKDLFRVNPCKHPIVILQDVSYVALKNLLQFMYQGEVSVSQEEIPAFMKVAETLKVKGLTDNTDASNGLPTNNKNSFGIINDPNINRHDMLKRPSRAAKKIVRPMPLENLKTPKILHSPQPFSVGAKKPHLETFDTSPICGASLSPTLASSPLQNEALPLIKLKEEPLIEEDDTENMNIRMGRTNFGTRSSEETDLANILDTQLSGEPSPSSQSWSGGNGEMVIEENSQPGIFGNLCIIKSGKGQLVLIHDGHMYTFVDQCENKGFWICVKKRMLNCSGCATTMHGQIVHSLGHNHPQIHDVIQRLQVPKSI